MNLKDVMDILELLTQYELVKRPEWANDVFSIRKKEQK